MPRRSLADVADTRAVVVDEAMRLASVEGLEGITIGRLAYRLQMSKSGLHGLFGTKLELQLAALEAGIAVFLEDVWEPAATLPAGRARLLEICDLWIGFHQRDTLPGGCFMTMAVVEWDTRNGPVHEAVALAMRRWLALLERDAEAAVQAGELPADLRPADVAFQLNAFAAAGSCGYQLTRNRAALAQARRCMRTLLGEDR
jgi:AcrR family transcriptional regulator